MCGRITLLPMVLSSFVVGVGQGVVVDALTFLDDLEGASGDRLRVFIQRVTENLLQCGGINPAADRGLPSHFVGTRHHRLFVLHVSLDLVGDGVHLVLKLFSQLAQVHEFFHLGDDAVVRVTHCFVPSFLFGQVFCFSCLLTVIIIHEFVALVNRFRETFLYFLPVFY